MYQTLELFPGITLRHIQNHRFKQGVLSVQFLRPMRREEAAKNALVPELLLRGCEQTPNLRQITARLDDLYGASLSALVRRVGDYQTLGLACSFIDDRFALPGDRVLEPMVDFLGQLLLCPLTEQGGFCQTYVRSEKKNLISALEAQRNDKQSYALGKLIKNMCKGSSLAVPRLGEITDVGKIRPDRLFAHYQKVLRESPVEIFYVGSASAQQVAERMHHLFVGVERQMTALPLQPDFVPGKPSHRSQKMDVAQGKLAMGFVTPITYADPRFAAMQLCNGIFGSGMTSRLFMQVREKRSLCYAIGSDYNGSKGLMTVYAGIDTHRCRETKEAILEQLDVCRNGEVTQQELESARAAVLSGLRAIYDSPGAMERFFSTNAMSGMNRDPETYAAEIRQVQLEDVVAAANTITYHSSFFLKGDDHA